MDAEQAIKATDEFKEAVSRLTRMQWAPVGACTTEALRQQREYVAVLEAQLRTALLHCA